MKLARRAVLRLVAGAAALPAASRMADAQDHPKQPPPAQSVAPLAERLAAYTDRLRFEDIDAATIERVKTHLIDTIGCGIGALDEGPVGICRNVALAVSGNATIIGTNSRTTTELASFANGAAFRYFDFNDTYVGRFSVHPSDHIAACLAVA
jgi:2-methylcitrate dehydratase